MLPLRFQRFCAIPNVSMRFCFILMVVMPAFAASPERATTVVRADRSSGRLVRTTVPVLSVAVESRAPESGLANSLQDPTDVVALVDRIASELGVENSLVHSVIRAESNYNARAVSPKG